MQEVSDLPAAIEPTEWHVVFHRKSMNRILSFLAFGEFKHVSAFGYLPGVKMWLVYDVQWSATRTMLMSKQSIIEWTAGCEILRIARLGERMSLWSRLGLYCVSAVKHLIGLGCVAATPDQLYRYILRNGGIDIGAGRHPAASG